MSEKITPEKTVSLALIEHTSRPLAYLIIAILAFFFVREPIFDLLRDAQKVKVGSFEVELRARVNQANVGDEFRALQSLDDEQLQLFLIVGKERSDKVPVIYEGEEAIEENFSKLRELGLLEYTKLANGRLRWRATEQGKKLHDAIRSELFSSLRSNPSP